MKTSNAESDADPQTKELIGQFRKCKFDGVSPLEYLGRGASSLVFTCTAQDGTPAALKVFDPAFLAHNAAAIEEERIRRQLDLRGHPHPHLVTIFNAGFASDANAHFLLMQHCDGNVLSSVVERIPREYIRPIISQIASAAKHLEDLAFVHRDIKPDNIMLSEDFRHATLLDLGVVLPLGVSARQEDTATLEFVGTPRYSPPEFILRTESGETAWRAITFYQLGAVLHDLIMQRPLFHDKKPKGRLYYSIFLDTPVINRTDVTPDLLALARLCLQMFSDAYSPPTLTELRSRLTALRASCAPTAAPVQHALPTAKYQQLALVVKNALIAEGQLFPGHGYALHQDSQCLIFTFSASHQHSLSRQLHVVLFPSFDTGPYPSALASFAFAGPLSPSAIAEHQSNSAVVQIETQDSVSAAAVRICTAAMLAVAEDAGIDTDGITIFRLGHYL